MGMEAQFPCTVGSGPLLSSAARVAAVWQEKRLVFGGWCGQECPRSGTLRCVKHTQWACESRVMHSSARSGTPD
jgi:hypothetical protein